MLAQHRGIASLGQVMAFGVTTCMVAGLTVLPALLNLWLRWVRPTKKPVRQCTIDTGSGGTEVKTQLLAQLKVIPWQSQP